MIHVKEIKVDMIFPYQLDRNKIRMVEFLMHKKYQISKRGKVVLRLT